MPGLRSTIKHYGSCIRSEPTPLSRKVVVKLEQHRFSHIFNKHCLVLIINLVCEELNEGSWLQSLSHHKAAHFC